jgi:hypothetical protein
VATVATEGRFTLKRIEVRNGPFTYATYRVEGKLNGIRIRKNFKSRHEAAGEKQRLEIEAANTDGAIAAQNTSLTAEQLREAEAAFHRLGGRSLSLAVSHFLSTYHEPATKQTIAEIIPNFLTEKKLKVKPPTYSNFHATMKAFQLAHGAKKPHEVTSFHVDEYLRSLSFNKRLPGGKFQRVPVGPKRWNNVRSDLSVFFNWCAKAPRKWIAASPVGEVEKHKIAHRTPEILSVQRCADLMAHVTEFEEGRFLLYFSLALFAGVRPSARGGEIVKVIAQNDERKLIRSDLGVIHIPPDIAKTGRVRQITIQPNLKAWIDLATKRHGSVVPPNIEKYTAKVRTKFELSPDVLRHTFASMHVGKFHSVGQAALESGNSETIIRNNYLNVVSEAEAKAFWQIMP